MLGLLTYPLYLVHSELGARLIRASAVLGPWPAVATGFGAVLLLSALIVRVERYPRRAILSCFGMRLGAVGQP
jgi:peptidoglycan/LPS O-acetylase OafA/YrhL